MSSEHVTRVVAGRGGEHGDGRMRWLGFEVIVDTKEDEQWEVGRFLSVVVL